MNRNLPTSPILLEAHIILDAKIFNIEYQALCNLQECVCGGSELPKSSENKAKTLTENFEWMLQQINLRSSELKQLQIMKCWLRQETSSKVMELLKGDSYLAYSEESLEGLLRKSSLQLMRLQYAN